MSTSAPSAAQLEDALYDILATGVDPTGVPGTLEAVQLVLHEHARKRKSQDELLAFFVRYGLPCSPPRATPVLPSLPASPEPDYDAMAPDVVPRGPRAASSRWHVAAYVACALALLGGAAVVTHRVVTDLHAAVAGVQAAGVANAAELSRSRAEAQDLRARLRDSERLLRQVDQKAELVLQSFASPLDPAAR